MIGSDTQRRSFLSANICLRSFNANVHNNHIIFSSCTLLPSLSLSLATLSLFFCS